MKPFLTFIFMRYGRSQGKQYGCFNGESCTLSSEEYSFEADDALYCTSSIKECNIYCLSSNSCQSVSIYSAAQSTNIICNATKACYDSTIRIGDTSIYPVSFASNYFMNNEATTTNVDCAADESCSFLTLYFDGTEQDQCSLSAAHPNAFYNGYFDCNLDIDEIHNNDNNSYGCNLFCADLFYSECIEATLNCNTNGAGRSYCKCHGDVCDIQKITIYPADDITTTMSAISPDSSDTESFVSTASLFESTTFKLILIALIIIIILLGCWLLICCWKFEAIYECVEQKRKLTKNKSVSRSQRVATQESMSHHEAIKKEDTAHDIRHVSDSQDTSSDDEDDEGTDPQHIKYAMGKFPATWYKYKTHEEYDGNNGNMNHLNLTTAVFSPESVISVLSELSPAPSAFVATKDNENRLRDRYKKRIEKTDGKQIKKPTKQNKKKPDAKVHSKQSEKEFEYKKVKMSPNSKRKARGKKKEKGELKAYDTDSSGAITSDADTDSEADTLSTDASSATDSASTSSTDSDSAESSSSSNEVKDGDGDTQTKELLNVDDMVANMVMFIQNTPQPNTDPDKKMVTYDDIV